MALGGAGKFIGGIRFGVSMDTKGVQRGASRARKQIRSFVGASTRMLGIYGGAAGVVAVIGKAANSYEQLNRSMNRSLSIMGKVSASMRRDMTAAAIEVSRTTNASAKEAADAYFFLASAGLDASQSLAALPKVAKFAQAGNFDLALATDLLTDAQSALGLTVKDTAKNMTNMQRVSDVLVKANTLANATVQQFSESLTNKAGAALRLVGKDIEEGVAVLAAFADQGVKGAEAGTGFGIVLRDLQTKAIKFGDEFRKAGVRVFDSAGEMRNMADIIGDLERRMAGMSDQTKKTFLLDLGFSDKSVAFVQALIGVSDKIKDYEAALRSAGGTTADVAGKMLTPMESAMSRLAAAFDKLAQSMEGPVNVAAALIEGSAAALNLKENVGKGLADLIGHPIQSDADAKRNAQVNVRNFLDRPGNITNKRRRELEQQGASERFNRLRSPAPERIVARGSEFNAFNRAKSFTQSPDSFALRSLPSRIGGALQQAGSGIFKQLAGQAQLGLARAEGTNLRDQHSALLSKQGPQSLSFTQAGSVESFRAKAAAKRLNEENKIRREQRDLLKKIAANTAKQEALEAANL